MSNVYVEPEYVIVNLMQADKKTYLSIGRLYRFVSYLQDQLSECAGLPEGQNVIFDINFDSIERSIWYNNKVFDLIGDIIVSKKDNAIEYIETPGVLADFISDCAKDFALKYAA
jgi:hypothetical protein